jgi:hypothetical protein
MRYYPIVFIESKLYVLNEKDKNRLISKIDNYILQFDLSSAGFTFFLSRVHLENYYQCGFSGMQLKIEINLQKRVILVLLVPVSYGVVSESTSFQILKHNFAIA